MKRVYNWILPDKMWKSFRLDKLVPIVYWGSNGEDKTRWSWVLHPFEEEVYSAREKTKIDSSD